MCHKHCRYENSEGDCREVNHFPCNKTCERCKHSAQHHEKESLFYCWTYGLEINTKQLDCEGFEAK